MFEDGTWWVTGASSGIGAALSPVNSGISAAKAADAILAGIAAGNPEIPIGRVGAPEMALLDLKRQAPERLFELMAGMAPKVARP